MPRIHAVALLGAALALGAGKADVQEAAPIPKDPTTGRYSLQGVVQAEGATSAELFARARAWVAQTYRSAQDVVQLEDASTGRLVAKGNFEIRGGLGMTVTIWHLLTIETKDGRYRYTLTDFESELVGNGTGRKPVEDPGANPKFLAKIGAEARTVVAGLKAAMQKPTPAADKDW